MAGRSKSSRSHFKRWHEWSTSSGDEHGKAACSASHKSQEPAATANEAVWRAVKRTSSAWRWLKLDLALLAEAEQHSCILDSLEVAISAMGRKVLPQFGIVPIPADLVRRPEVIDLVNVLGSLKRNSDGEDARPQGNSHGLVMNTKDCASQCAPSRKLVGSYSAAVQTNGYYMERPSCFETSGKWTPLSETLIRRGCILKCVGSARTSTTHVHNFDIGEDEICKVVDVDEDGDCKIIVLEEAHVKGLRFPSDARWLLRDSYNAFHVWQHSLASNKSASLCKESVDHEEASAFQPEIALFLEGSENQREA